MTSIERWVVRSFWIVPLAVYWYTACPGAAWIDGPMIVNNVVQLTTGTWVNNHNLFHAVARVWTFFFPLAQVHYALNLLCGVFGAVTVHFIFLAGYRLTHNVVAACIGGVALTLSHSLWWHSTVLEVYTLNTALFAITLYFIVRYDESRDLWDLYRAVFCFGLGASNHVLMGLFVFAFVALWFWPSQWGRLWEPRVLAGTAIAFALGFQLFLFVFLTDYSRELNRQPVQTVAAKIDTFEHVVHQMTGGEFKRHMFPELSTARKWRWRLNYLFLLLMNYPSVAFLLGWVGLVAFFKLRERRLTLLWFLVAVVAQALWSANYVIWDMYAFGLPVWVAFAVLVILGADWVWRRGHASRIALAACSLTLLAAPPLYASIARWGYYPPGGVPREEAGFWQRYFSQFEYVSNVWDPARYFADPNKRGYDAADRVADHVFAALPPGSHLFDDDGKGYYPIGLYHQRVLGRRPDLHIHSIFGPFLDSEQIDSLARQIKTLLGTGQRVYISSPYWPERPVLDKLYELLAREEQGQGFNMRGMSVEQLESTFPRYRLERVPISDSEPLYIYELVPRRSRGS